MASHRRTTRGHRRYAARQDHAGSLEAGLPAGRRIAHGHRCHAAQCRRCLVWSAAPVLRPAERTDGKRQFGALLISVIPRASSLAGTDSLAGTERALPARVVRMSLPVRIMESEGGTATVDDGKASGMTDHNGVLMMQRALLAGTLGLAMAQKAAAILEGEPNQAAPSGTPDDAVSQGPQLGGSFGSLRDPRVRCCGPSWTRPANASAISMTGRQVSDGVTRCSTCSTWPRSPPSWVSDRAPIASGSDRDTLTTPRPDQADATPGRRAVTGESLRLSSGRKAQTS